MAVETMQQRQLLSLSSLVPNIAVQWREGCKSASCFVAYFLCWCCRYVTVENNGLIFRWFTFKPFIGVGMLCMGKKHPQTEYCLYYTLNGRLWRSTCYYKRRKLEWPPNVMFFCSLWLGQQQVWKTHQLFMGEERRGSLEKSIGFVGLGRCVSVWVCRCVGVQVGEYTYLLLHLHLSSQFNCNKAANTGHKRYASSPSSSKDVKKPTNTWTNTCT